MNVKNFMKYLSLLVAIGFTVTGICSQADSLLDSWSRLTKSVAKIQEAYGRAEFANAIKSIVQSMQFTKEQKKLLREGLKGTLALKEYPWLNGEDFYPFPDARKLDEASVKLNIDRAILKKYIEKGVAAQAAYYKKEGTRTELEALRADPQFAVINDLVEKSEKMKVLSRLLSEKYVPGSEENFKKYLEILTQAFE